jgi:hypothetical protein
LVTEEERQRLSNLLEGMARAGEGIGKCVDQLVMLLNIAAELLVTAQKILERQEQPE